MMSFEALLPLALSRASRHVKLNSYGCHGVGHWRRVARYGALLAAATPGADADVVVAFSVFHDTQRHNEGRDPKHGPRAAETVKSLPYFGLDAAQLGLLYRACRDHTRGFTTSDEPTIGVCFDADRLDLDRVGTRTSAKLLSTKAGKTCVA